MLIQELCLNVSFINLNGSSLRIKDDLMKSLSDIIDNSQFIGGEYLDKCEEALGKKSDRKALCVSSGTDALLLALMALDLKPGQVVFVPSFTFAASAEVIALLGAIPYFVDVNIDDYNICTQDLWNAIQAARSEGMDLAGIISVDLFGQPAHHDEISKIACSEKLWVINDAAQSFGATYEGRPTLTKGIISTTSFFPAKPLGCFGDGGAIFLDDDDLIEKVKSLRVHGQGTMRYTYQRVGINGRFDNIQAAVILKKLAFFDEEVRLRNQIARKYNEALSDICHTPHIHNNRTSVYAQYTIRVNQNQRGF